MTSKYNIFLKTILEDIIPKTKISINQGNKIFGAAILKKNDYSLVCVGTNNEIINPLFHGEISTLINFYNIPINKRPNPKDCFFLSTHEPCSLCLSAITWSGFNNFYYFFPYEETKNKFYIPHDLNILKEVFKINNGKYKKNNNYWKSYSIIDLIKKSKNYQKFKFDININKINKIYKNFSKIYQKKKKNKNIPLK
tara:strand:+ start:434 stop:1021 length:588 start_codon:yes stop_codon:yes gene_type:complete